MKYLPLYYEWVKTNRMPRAGLCSSFTSKQLALFSVEHSCNYWGYWGELSDEPILSTQVEGEEREKLLYGFTPLRQNIVLLLAAMNNEL